MTVGSPTPPPQAGASPAAEEKRRRLANACLAISLANLCLIKPWFNLLYEEDFGYFNLGPINFLSLAALGLNLLLFAVVFWLGAEAVRILRRPWFTRLAALAVLVALLLPLNFIRMSYFPGPQFMLSVLGKDPLVLLLGAVVCGATWYWYPGVLRLLRMGLWIALPMTLVSGGKSLLALTRLNQTESQMHVPAPAPALPQTRAFPRIVWLVFDEFDYRLVFPERPKGLSLQELDRLRAEGLFATNAFPPAPETLFSLPSLISGVRVSHARPCAADDLTLELEGPEKTTTWKALPNVFARLRALGHNSAIVGWYHPYQRLFNNQVAACDWFPSPVLGQGQEQTLGAAMANQILSNFQFIEHRRRQLQVQLGSDAAVQQAITNRQYGLCFFHLPAPHGPGIYLPAEDRYTLTHYSVVASYFDSVVLVDRMVGRMRRELEAAGMWDQTWVIISSDHWWRAADLHDGRIDQRVPFLLKGPGKGAPVEFDARFNTMLTQELVLAIMQEKVRSLPQAQAWLMQHRSALGPTSGRPKGQAAN